MTIRVALNHKTSYRYDRRVSIGAQVVRLRPAPHSRTPIESYSLTVTPEHHFLNWQQDPFGNYLARCLFQDEVEYFEVQVDLVANMTVINPFDFFLEANATEYPFAYDDDAQLELRPYMLVGLAGPQTKAFLNRVDYRPRRTIDFLVDLNSLVQQSVAYTLRMEPGVQTPEETLQVASGSCRDSAWLLVHVLRQLGFAARFVSGYLIQLAADQKSLDGPSGPEQDFTDLHAWTEVYLPGAGWIGLDPTSGLFASEGHIPLACTPQPTSAAPITGTLGECNVEFSHQMSVTRIYEDPRVTLPYSEPQWSAIQDLGHAIDRQLKDDDVRLTMGGEPTFVSIDDMAGDEWQTAAVGPTKRRLAYDLLLRLKRRFGTGGVLHFGQGKWYPGESLPRWAMAIYWRKDGEPIWRDDSLLANTEVDYGHGSSDAQQFAQRLAERLGVRPEHAVDAFEDGMYYMWRERRLPANVDLRDPKLENREERERIARIFEQGLTAVVGVALPIRHHWWDQQPHWVSGPWVVRADEMFLVPGDSPMGYRLPLESLLYEATREGKIDFYSADPLEAVSALPSVDAIRQGVYRTRLTQHVSRHAYASTIATQPREQRVPAMASAAYGDLHIGGNEGQPPSNGKHESFRIATVDDQNEVNTPVIRTALCVEPREGRLHVFLPPTDRLESFLDLVSAIEDTAAELNTPVVIEGYPAPVDTRIERIAVTPDPGVIEVNVHPAYNWNHLQEITTGVYADARESRLGTEKFDLDGNHTGTCGGNHVVIGGATPAESPWLRRPDLLKSFVMYWHNHPSLSYLFSTRFIGPTSQAPRVDESRADSLYELKIACEQIKPGQSCPPWMVDRVFRHLLVDGTGNTHRSEICIDKLYSPDSATGRLGLVEFRGFEMPPHSRMSLAQQLLLRAMMARFWREPYDQSLVSWSTTLHDRFLLPHFVWEDFRDVIGDLVHHDFHFDLDWFAPHFEFRYPKIGEFCQRSVHVELRKAVEPWYVLGEENTSAGTARFVDSSVERLQVKVRGMVDSRHVLTCNGRRVPLHPTGVQGEFVAGVRYRAWQPPSCLHPTIPVDAPLVFDLVDSWNKRSIGGCQHHVGNPTGLNPSSYPVNAFEAESRRAARFFDMGHTAGRIETPSTEENADFPFTLDLRYGRS